MSKDISAVLIVVLVVLLLILKKTKHRSDLILKIDWSWFWLKTPGRLMMLLWFPSLCLLILRDHSRGACANTLRLRWLAFQNERRRFSFSVFHFTDTFFPPSKSTTPSSTELSPHQRGPPFAFFPILLCPIQPMLHSREYFCINRCCPETPPPLSPPPRTYCSVASAASYLRCDSTIADAKFAWLWTPERLQVSASLDQHWKHASCALPGCYASLLRP